MKRGKNILPGILTLEKPKPPQTWGKISLGSRFPNQVSTRSQDYSASLSTGLCILPTTLTKTSRNATEKSQGPSIILYLQRISQLKNRKELTKQGNLAVFFRRFFKRIITTILASANIAWSSSSPSPVRLFCVWCR